MGFELTMVLGIPVLSHTAQYQENQHFAGFSGNKRDTNTYPIHHFITHAAMKLDIVPHSSHVNRLYNDHACKHHREFAPPGWFPPGVGGDRPVVRDKYDNFNYWINPEHLLGALIMDWKKTQNPFFYVASQLLGGYRSYSVAGGFTDIQGLLYGH